MRIACITAGRAKRWAVCTGSLRACCLTMTPFFSANCFPACPLPRARLKRITRLTPPTTAFTLPSAPEQMPPALQIAASATLLMTEFKLADQIDDGAKGHWKLAQKLYSPGFYAAAERLKALDFPVMEMREWYGAQAGRETAALSGEFSGSPREILAFVAEPTATVTGLVFQHGAAALGIAARKRRGRWQNWDGLSAN